MVEDSRPLALLVNPTSCAGRALKALPIVEKHLDLLHIPFRVEITRSGEHAVEEALRAAQHHELPVVLSGDGLIGMVGGALAGSDKTFAGGERPRLGIVPCGRGNDLARALGIPSDPRGAIDLVASGQFRRIDAGEANGVPFLGIASAGFDSDANRIANEARLVRGRAVYAYAALRALAAWRPAKFRILAGGERRSFTGYSVAVANSPAYGGGMMMAPDARMDDGQFDVVCVKEVGKLRFLLNLPSVFRGEHLSRPEVEVFRARNLELSASRPFELYADGEYITDLPAKLRVLPDALEVCAPGEESSS